MARKWVSRMLSGPIPQPNNRINWTKNVSKELCACFYCFTSAYFPFYTPYRFKLHEFELQRGFYLSVVCGVFGRKDAIQHVHTQMIHWHGPTGTVFSVDIQPKKAQKDIQRLATSGSDKTVQVTVYNSSHPLSSSTSYPLLSSPFDSFPVHPSLLTISLHASSLFAFLNPRNTPPTPLSISTSSI